MDDALEKEYCSIAIFLVSILPRILTVSYHNTAVQLPVNPNNAWHFQFSLTNFNIPWHFSDIEKKKNIPWLFSGDHPGSPRLSLHELLTSRMALFMLELSCSPCFIRQLRTGGRLEAIRRFPWARSDSLHSSTLSPIAMGRIFYSELAWGEHCNW